jgi:hypothetical protein
LFGPLFWVNPVNFPTAGLSLTAGLPANAGLALMGNGKDRAEALLIHFFAQNSQISSIKMVLV